MGYYYQNNFTQDDKHEAELIADFEANFKPLGYVWQQYISMVLMPNSVAAQSAILESKANQIATPTPAHQERDEI